MPLNLAPIRVEVIEARRSRRAGAIVLARPVPLKVAASCGGAIVLAPAAGTITALGYDLGQSVQAGGVIATVLPQGRVLEARLLIPSHAKSSVTVGQQVHMRIDAFPYQKYGLVTGTIKQVELNPINDGARAPDAPNVPDMPMYRATVALSTNSMMMYGKPKSFEPGLTLEANIFNDRRRLIEWIIDPLVSAAKDRIPPEMQTNGT